MTRTALPSPRGTNYERLYLANSLAHDAAMDPRTKAADRRRGRARDEGEPDDDLSEIVTELQGIFRQGLADADVVRADQLLEQLLGFCGGEGEDEETGDPNQQNETSGLRDQRRGMDRRMPTAADLAGGGMGLDRRWPSRGGDARSEASAEADFQRRFGCGPPPRQV
jgi:hypothetical protein